MYRNIWREASHYQVNRHNEIDKEQMLIIDASN
jgi:hypothetical protein